MPKLQDKVGLMKNTTIYFVYLLIIWGFYRFLFRLPEEIEELVVKPVIWLIPVFYMVFRKERGGLSSLGITFKNLFSAIYFSIGLGSIFVVVGLLANLLKHGSINFEANIGDIAFLPGLGLTFATALSEEITFRGYLFTRLWKVFKSEWSANLITTLAWTAIHVPVAFFVWRLSFPQGIVFLLLTAMFGFGSSFVFARTKNIVSSILLHVLWQWPIILFR